MGAQVLIFSPVMLILSFQLLYNYHSFGHDTCIQLFTILIFDSVVHVCIKHVHDVTNVSPTDGENGSRSRIYVFCADYFMVPYIFCISAWTPASSPVSLLDTMPSPSLPIVPWGPPPSWTTHSDPIIFTYSRIMSRFLKVGGNFSETMLSMPTLD